MPQNHRIKPHNPQGFEHNTWNYRVVQLRHALGWSQKKLASALGINTCVLSPIERGKVTRPALITIQRIKALEAVYADILKEYKKAPARNDRLRKKGLLGRYRRNEVYLKPIEIRRPEDLESLGKVETNSDDLFFGRKTRQRVQQSGISDGLRYVLQRRSRAMRKTHAKRRDQLLVNKEVQSGQPLDAGSGEGGLDSGVHQKGSGQE